jgi:hypothetical protein
VEKVNINLTMSLLQLLTPDGELVSAESPLRLRQTGDFARIMLIADAAAVDGRDLGGHTARRLTTVQIPGPCT